MQQLLRGYRTILPDMYASGLTPVISWVNKPVVSPNHLRTCAKKKDVEKGYRCVLR